MADRPLSAEEAESFIQHIRADRNVGSDGKIKQDANTGTLKRALELLSQSLYTKPTHFLLELIQNADDNEYPPDVEPCLSVAYRDNGYLFVACNEMGFTEGNVRAICDIGGTTKKSSGPRKGYIGEKGVGFKSVFKVADQVWISSGHFKFKFDKSQPLGMLVPVLSSFLPRSPVHGATMFAFHIPDPNDRKAVRESLLRLDAEFLLFLNKLVKIEVKMYHHDGAGELPWYSRTYTCEEGDLDGCSKLIGKSSSSLHRDIRQEFYSTRFTVTDLPAENKRMGVAETDIVLGFPLSGQTSATNRVYNFLPVRSYGLAFLLQADFILTTNRQDIVQDNEWNDHLTFNAIQAFLAAVEEFNECGVCKYDWPSFIYHSRDQSAHGTIFETFVSDLCEALKDVEVLEHQDYKDKNRKYAEPCSLVSVPRRFTDGSLACRPLLNDSRNLQTYVSPKYNQSHLQKLGVRQQTTREFHDALYESGKIKPGWIQAQTSLWHERLASAILDTNPELFRDIPLIPLGGGIWVSANDGPLYFANADDLRVPEDIEVKTVEKTACRSPQRQELFRRFGVQSLTEQQICERIARLHGSGSWRRRSHSRKIMVYHAWYIYRYAASNLQLKDLQFTSRSGILTTGRDMYLGLPQGSFNMKDYFSQEDSPCKILHDDYLEYDRSNSNWRRWLESAVGMARLPRLLEAGRISPEFVYLIEKYPSQVWLNLLRRNWAYYQHSANEMGPDLGRVKVECVGHRPHPLNQTYLGTDSVLQTPFVSGCLPILDVPDPGDSDWQNLRSIGLRLAPDLQLYLRTLTGVARQPPSTLTPADLVRLYSAVESHYNEDPEAAKNAFATHSLIRLPSDTSFRWLKISECRWKTLSCLQSVTALNVHFSGLRKLFVDKLGVAAKADTRDILGELLSLPEPPVGQQQRVKTLMLALSSCKDLERHQKLLQKLSDKSMFPVLCSTEKAFRRAKSKDWFIPDSQRLRTCFLNCIWVLDFEVDEIPLLSTFLDQMNLSHRCLSTQVNEKTITHGAEVFQPKLSRFLRKKTGYILRLLPPMGKEALTSHRHKLKTVELMSSEELVLRRSVEIDGEVVYGADDRGRVILKAVDEPMILFCSAADIAQGQLPWHFIVEQLADYFDISKDKQMTLSSILQNADASYVEDILEREKLLDIPIGAKAAVSETSDSEESRDEELLHDAAYAQDRSHHNTAGTSMSSIRTSLEGFENVTPRIPWTPTGGLQQASTPERGGQTFYKPVDIDESTIVASAQGWERGDIRILVPDSPSISDVTRTVRHSFVEDIHTPTSSRLSIRSPNGRLRSSSRQEVFQMCDLKDALPGASTASLPQSDAATSSEHEIGYGGELFVFTLLQQEIHADESSWTSRMRSRHGFSPFTKLEGEHSDFTLHDPEMVRNFTTWLVSRGISHSQARLERVEYYHLEVKTTLGDLNEPFIVSNNQMRLCRNAHVDPARVYIILRVYQLKSSPRFEIYIDPWALMMNGKLDFAAQGGYLVRG